MILWAEPKNQVKSVMAPNKSGLLAPAHGWVGDFGVKNDQKVSYNMILMSRYMGQLHGGRGPKKSGKALPPL